MIEASMPCEKKKQKTHHRRTRFEQTHLKNVSRHHPHGRLKNTLDQIEFVEDAADDKKVVNEGPLH